MFHDIPPAMLARMRHLETLDAADRTDGTPHGQRLRQVPPDTGRFLAILAAAAPPGRMVEVGTSGGYSALWLSLACRAKNERLVSIDNDPAKVALARETFAQAGVTDFVQVVQGDALAVLADIDAVAFAFIDATREMLEACLNLVLPRLVPGGILAADNVISHAHQIPGLVDRVLADPRLDGVVAPIGSGVLLCRRPTEP